MSMTMTMQVHLIGGLLGRFVGYLIYYMNGSNTIPDNTLIQVPGYAKTFLLLSHMSKSTRGISLFTITTDLFTRLFH